MIIINNVVVTREFLEARFACNIPRCKGECCVAGDAGAPLEKEEIGLIEENIDEIKPYMRSKGIDVIEKDGTFDYDDCGNFVTPLVNNEECAFVYFHDNGAAFCAIEKAFSEGKSTFLKPISCHLYPVRLVEKNGFIHLMYHQWSVCVPAVRKGIKDGMPLYKYLKSPLIRRFGEDWYNQLLKEIAVRIK